MIIVLLISAKLSSVVAFRYMHIFSALHNCSLLVFVFEEAFLDASFGSLVLFCILR